MSEAVVPGFDLAARLDAELAVPEWTKLDDMLKELPPGVPILSAVDARNFAKYQNRPQRLYSPAEAWQRCADTVEKNDSELCKAYREEIDTLLVFAGLFSAVITGFSVESYQWLKADSTDVTNSLLSSIAISLNGDRVAAVIGQHSSGMAPSVAVRVNAYWFVSLSLSLSTALVSILGKQWTREFERHTTMSPKDFVGVRQLKFEGLQYWKVGLIISALPLILQLALALFAVGIIELLWHLHAFVAIVVCIPTASAVLFYVATTLLPVIQYSLPSTWILETPQCAYKSPQAMVALQVCQIITRRWRRLRNDTSYVGRRLLHWIGTWIQERGFLRNLRLPDDTRYYVLGGEWIHSWSRWDWVCSYIHDRDEVPPAVPISYFRGLRWMVDHMDKDEIKYMVWCCLWEEACAEDGSILGRGERLSQGLLHAFPLEETKKMLLDASPRSCAILSSLATNMPSGFISEMLVQHLLPDVQPQTAGLLLRSFPRKFSSDTRLLTALMKVVSTYCRAHLREDLAEVILGATMILTNCPDNAVRAALRRCVLTLMMNWLRLRTFTATSGIRIATGKTLFLWMRDLSRDVQQFVSYPLKLHNLPEVQDMAALVRAYCEMHGQLVTWPLGVAFDYDSLRAAELKGWRPMTMELLKISICGVSPAPVVLSSHKPATGDPISAIGRPGSPRHAAVEVPRGRADRDRMHSAPSHVALGKAPKSLPTDQSLSVARTSSPETASGVERPGSGAPGMCSIFGEHQETGSSPMCAIGGP